MCFHCLPLGSIDFPLGSALILSYLILSPYLILSLSSLLFFFQPGSGAGIFVMVSNIQEVILMCDNAQEPHGEWQLNVVYASLGGAQELLKCPGAYVAKTKDPVRFGY